MIKILLLGLIVILSFSRTFGQNMIVTPVKEITKTASKTNNITDTIIQEIEIKHISQTIIEYKISAHHYDSLGYSFGFDVIGKAYSDSSIFSNLKKRD